MESTVVFTIYIRSWTNLQWTNKKLWVVFIFLINGVVSIIIIVLHLFVPFISCLSCFMQYNR